MENILVASEALVTDAPSKNALGDFRIITDMFGVRKLVHDINRFSTTEVVAGNINRKLEEIAVADRKRLDYSLEQINKELETVLERKLAMTWNNRIIYIKKYADELIKDFDTSLTDRAMMMRYYIVYLNIVICNCKDYAGKQLLAGNLEVVRSYYHRYLRNYGDYADDFLTA